MTFLDWNTPDPVCVDLETISSADLKTNRQAYFEHVNILVAVFATQHKVWAWFPAEHIHPPAQALWPPKTRLHKRPIVVHSGELSDDDLAILAQTTIVAHNAFGFDSRVWSSCGLPAAGWIDTMPLARLAGLPGGLDRIGMQLLGQGKSKEQHQAMKFCVPNKYGKVLPWTQHGAALVGRYCVQDTLLLEHLFRVEVDEYRGLGFEDEVQEADRIVNARGYAIDDELICLITAKDDGIKRLWSLKVEEDTLGVITAKDLNRVQFLRQWLSEKGCVLDNLQRATVERLMEDEREDLPDDVLTVLRARLSAAMITGSKASKMRSLSDTDGRLRDSLVYHAALPGRWGGRGFQPQNLVRPDPRVEDWTQVAKAFIDDDYETLDALTSGVDERGKPWRLDPEAVISGLIRLCVCATVGETPATTTMLAVVDYSQVEARGIAWLAGDQQTVDDFAKGVPIYKAEAARLFGISVAAVSKLQRTVGKIAVLGLGYQMGVERFKSHAKASNVDLEALGLDAKEIVFGWRKQHSAIKQLWYDLDAGIRELVAGGPSMGARQIGRQCLWWTEDRRGVRNLYVQLPSHGIITYRDVKIEQIEPIYAKGTGVLKPTVTYAHPSGGRRVSYGGRWAENITQRLCRDFMAWALVQLLAKGKDVVLHVHDECVAEVPVDIAEQEIEEIGRIMIARPEWALDFPLAADGYLTDRYAKKPPEGQMERVWT